MSLRLNWTVTLIIVCTGVFFLQILNLFDWSYFAFTPAYAFERPWTFITSMFLHADITHLFFNMFALFVFGLPLERIIGSQRFIVLYFLSGILGSIGYILTSSNPFIPAIGASGAIYGVMGTLAMLMPNAMVFIFGLVPMPMFMAVIFWTLSEFLGLFAPSNIANGAHLGGLFLGLVYGYYLRKQAEKNAPKQHKIHIEGYADWER